MGYLSQETSVFRKLTVEQNILAILEVMPVARTLGRKLTRQERRQRTDDVLEQFGLNKVRRNVAARLSGGEKRRLEIARCLVCEPLLILLDEPFTGIDPITIADIRGIVRDLRAQGIGLLLTDHNVREALKITDRSYLIKDGKVRTHGSPQQIIHDPIAISEYLGKGFNDNTFGPEPESEPAAAAEPPAAPPPPAPPADRPATEPAVYQVLEQEKIHRLIERLRTEDASQAAAELAQRGAAAVPALVEALERRDVEMRRQALQVLQNILGVEVDFDPYAPEAVRRQQIAQLRDGSERKAG
jgi:lipopolysaccharide export system ATP-binding protein